MTTAEEGLWLAFIKVTFSMRDLLIRCIQMYRAIIYRNMRKRENWIKMEGCFRIRGSRRKKGRNKNENQVRKCVLFFHHY